MIFDKIFNVEAENEKFVFLSCNIADKDKFIDEYLEYFFDEKVMFNHFNYLYNVPFTPTKENFIHLYYELKKFIDSFNMLSDAIPVFQDIEGIENVLVEENKIEKKDDTFTYRFDKAGKIGEYFFSVLLERFFNLHCIIPKSKYLTDYNMSVYGIDVLYLNEKDNSLFFGESKFTKNILYGVCQINKSLKTYEKQISDEYEIILNAWDSREAVYKLSEIFGEKKSCSISFKEFIDKAEIKQIFIPLFIMHGCEINPSDIMEKMNNISRVKIFNLDVKFVLISLPIVCKEDFMKRVTSFIDLRMKKYGSY